jgi:hypothetical protein
MGIAAKSPKNFALVICHFLDEHWHSSTLVALEQEYIPSPPAKASTLNIEYFRAILKLITMLISAL